MKKFIKKLQNKPEHIRKQILYACMAVSGSLIFALWAFTLSHRLSSVEASSIKDDLKPIGLIKENLVETYKGLSGGSDKNN